MRVCHFPDLVLAATFSAALTMQSANISVFSMSFLQGSQGKYHVISSLWIWCNINSRSLHTCWRFWWLFPWKIDCSYKSWQGEEKWICLCSSKSWQTKIIKNRNSSRLKTPTEQELVDRFMLILRCSRNWFMSFNKEYFCASHLTTLLKKKKKRYHFLFTFPWLFLFLLAPQRSGLKSCQKRAPFHPF